MSDKKYENIERERRVDRFLDRVRIVAQQEGVTAFLCTGLIADEIENEDAFNVCVNTATEGLVGKHPSEIEDLAHIISQSAVNCLMRIQQGDR